MIKGLKPYRIKFRKKRGGKLHSHVNFHNNITDARKWNEKMLGREYGDDAYIVSITVAKRYK